MNSRALGRERDSISVAARRDVNSAQRDDFRHCYTPSARTPTTRATPERVGALSDTDTVAITVNAVNDAPVNTVPGAQTTP